MCTVQWTEWKVDDIEQALLRCNKIKPGTDFLVESLESDGREVELN